MTQEMTVNIGEHSYHVQLKDGGCFVNGQWIILDEAHLDNRGGLFYRSESRSERAVLDQSGNENFLLYHGREYVVAFESERERLLKQFAGRHRKEHHHAEIRALMPGLIVRIAVEQGQMVSKGEPVLILEAMKMENEIRATADGIVKEIRFQKGQAVEKGDLLIVLD